MANTANITLLSVAEINALLANSTSNSALTTDFNVTPYYDDYSDEKNFYRIVYKPGYAVQARELTQSQTILQKQIERFGRHFFKEGSIVVPGQFGIETNLDYVKIKDFDNANNAVNVTDFLNQIIVGQTNGVSAYIIDVADGVQTETDTKTLFVRYLSGSADSTVKTFSNNEVLLVGGNTPFNAVTVDSGAVGKGSRFIIQEGVVFAKEHFVKFPTSSVVLSRYSTNPTCRVGFNITEDFVTSNQDASLLDPALESSNYSAPGADRFRLTPTLQVLEITDNTGFPNFVELFTIENGIITELYNRPQYNIVRDELAKRTMDESGDYYVNGMNVRVRENLDTGVNDGLNANGNNSLLSIGVEPGLAYVKGYEVAKLGVTTYISTEKSATYQNVASQTSTATMGDYIIANEYTGNIEHDKGTIVFLKDTASRRLTNGQWAATSGSGNTIGTARVLSVEYEDGTLGTPSGNVAVYLTDIKMNGVNSFALTKSIAGTNFGADVILDGDGNALLKESQSRTLLYYTGSYFTRTLRDSSGSGSMLFNFKRTVPVSISSTGDFTATIATTGESFPYGTTGDLSNADRRDMILTIDSDANIAGPVGATVSNTGNFVVSGSASARFTRFNVGDKITFSGNSKAYFISSINNDTALVVTERLPFLSGNSYFKAYKNGDVIDLTTKGFDAGAERDVSTTSSQLSFALKESFGGSGVTGELTYQAVRAAGEPATKTLNANRYVIINCATAGTSGPFNLGFPDIYKIRNIVRKTGSAPANITDGTDVTANFTLDNGQRDNMYDHGRITPRGIVLGSTDYLLVHLDYFTPGTFSTGKGYFSVDSYPINDVTSSNTTIRTENVPVYTSPQDNRRYDLRNYIDFRPVKAITAIDATTPGSASTNPAPSGDFVYDTNGLRLVAPTSQFSYDYSFYESRRDLVIIDKDGNISVVKSNPGQSPITPPTPENTMALANIFVAPYPSLAPNYAQRINRKDLACRITKVANIRYTMKDIGVLKRRIENLEYYASLNLLEKAALDLKVLDENGNDRFKNGIFADTFADHILGDRRSADYKIVVDQIEKTIRPIYTMGSTYYEFANAASSGVKRTGDLITLPYTETVLIQQPKVTSYRNIEFTSYRFIGNMFLFPETDVWVDTNYAPDEQITIGPDGNNLPQGTTVTWNAWQTKITGYHIAASVASDGDRYAEQNLTPDQFNNLATYLLPGIDDGFRGTFITNPNSPADQVVTETTETTRTGVEKFASGVTESSESIGNKVIDVGIVPYIRPQIIMISVQGLKANTEFYTFFDGENMSNYVSQFIKKDPFEWRPTYRPEENDIPYPVASFQPPIQQAIFTKTEGDPLISDSNGAVYFMLRLPTEKRFRTGTKEVVVTDSPTNSVLDATSSSKAYFVSQGLTQKKQNTILTTREVIYSEKTITESTKQSKVVGYIDRPSCSAYSFVPKAPDGEEGIFLTSVDLYFARKHPTLGVWVEIREMSPDGGITRTQVPTSELWYSADQLNVSEDASVPTTFKFKNPVFLYNNVQYAFVIHTVGLNPDTYLWISRLGETDIKTGTKHNSRPLTGTFYTTNNNLNWDIVPDVDLLITFKRAEFTTGTVGTAILGNRPLEKLVVANVSSAFNNYGERILGRTRLTLTGNTALINIGDYLVGQTSNANSAVISNTGPYIVANNQYITNERLSIVSPTGTFKAQTVATTVTTAGGVLYSYGVREGVSRLEIISSNGNFLVGDTVKGEISGSTATVEQIENYRYSVADFEPTYLSFNKTDIAFQMQSVSNTGTIGGYTRINDSSNYLFDDERSLYSRTNEVASLSGDYSNKVRVRMSTTSSYMSPVLDLARTHTVFVDNQINENTVGEIYSTAKLGLTGNTVNIAIGDFLTGQTSGANSTVLAVSGNTITMSTPITDFRNGETVTIKYANTTSKNLTSVISDIDYEFQSPSGQLTNKYLSQIVTLAEGQDAEDMKVILTAYRPPGTDVKVYIRLLQGEDSSVFNRLRWYELEKEDDGAFSSLANRNDFREFIYKLPASMLTGPNGEVQYTNNDGITFTGYKYYQVKIGLTGTNSAIVPRVGDLRVIALQL